MQPPPKLSAEAKALWRGLVTEFSIDDPGGLAILQSSLEALDRLRECQKAIAKDGVTIVDRWGQTKSHPLLSTERDARAQFMSGLKQLNLDLEPLRDRVGRPGGQ